MPLLYSFCESITEFNKTDHVYLFSFTNLYCYHDIIIFLTVIVVSCRLIQFFTLSAMNANSVLCIYFLTCILLYR